MSGLQPMRPGPQKGQRTLAEGAIDPQRLTPMYPTSFSRVRFRSWPKNPGKICAPLDFFLPGYQEPSSKYAEAEKFFGRTMQLPTSDIVFYLHILNPILQPRLSQLSDTALMIRMPSHAKKFICQSVRLAIAQFSFAARTGCSTFC